MANREVGVKFTNNSIRVKRQIDNAVIPWLYEAAGELEAQVKRNTRVDTGQTKGSWSYRVNESKLEAVVGSPMENAIWEEFGTGEFALHGDGRKTPWHYKDRKGKWHTTTGKRGTRAFYRAFKSTKNAIIQSLKDKLRRMR